VLLWRYGKENEMKPQFRRANFLTRSTALVEILLTFLPNLIFGICTVLGINHYQIIGPYVNLTIAVNALIAAGIYRYVAKASMRHGTIKDIVPIVQFKSDSLPRPTFVNRARVGANGSTSSDSL
jgi:hypothetical protein